MNSWHAVSPQGQQMGPMSREQVIQMIRGGSLRADSLVWTESFGGNWKPIAQSEFAYLLNVQPSAPPPPNPPIPPPSYASWKQNSTHPQSAGQNQFSPTSAYIQNQSFTEKSIVVIVYIFYLAGIFSFSLSTIVGLIIAYIKRRSSSPVAQTHFTFQIYTFWLPLLFSLFFLLGALVFALALFLSPTLGATLGVGLYAAFVIYLLLFLPWYLIRIIKGIIYANDNRAISQPRSWWFG